VQRPDFAFLLPYCQSELQQERLNAIIENGIDATSRNLNVDAGSLRNLVRKLKVRATKPADPAPAITRSAIDIDEPVSDIDVDALVARRVRQFERKAIAEQSRALLTARVNLQGPIGVLFFGDPHVDDDGTDLGLLLKHAALVRETEGLFGANVGDSTNNWIGRLARLYAQQSTTAAEAWALCEHFIHAVRDWLFILSGNHDAWSGAGDPLSWICRQGGNLYETNVRMRIDFPNGAEVYVNARHDFSGHSMWNPAHGVGRAVQQGMWDDLAIAGHRHVSGYMVLKAPTDGRICHAVQVASYKIYDRYAKEKGFRDQNVSPAVVVIIDPEKPVGSPSRLSVFHDVEEGVEFLKWRRAR
jgi:hypothetical protein